MAMRRLPGLPVEQRLAWFLGFGLTSWMVAGAATLLGHAIAPLVQGPVLALLLFVNPLYFGLILAGEMRAPPSRRAVIGGCCAAPLVLVLHGLTGSSSSLYVLGLQQQLATRGWSSVAINWRGCSGEPNLLPRGYHSGASEDLAATVEHLRRVRPLAPLYAVGYSLGGNVLLKYLGESGEGCTLSGAVAVSVPFRLDQCADRIGAGFSRVYQRHFMREMVSYGRGEQRVFAPQGQAGRLAVLAERG
eukprot:gene5927-7369_t